MVKMTQQESEAYNEAAARIAQAEKEGWTELNLSSLGLSEVPPEIGQLTILQILDLQNNGLATISDSLVQLSQLKTLYLGGNELTAVPDWLADLSQLEVLDLRENGLTSIPESLAQLSNLKDLDIGYNWSITIPYTLGQLYQIETLSLNGINLTSIPKWLANLPHLKQLYLCANGLKTIPDSLAKMIQLEELDLSDNQLTAFPDILSQLPQLNTLSLSGNQISTIPKSLPKLPNLQTLDLSDNQLSDVPNSIARYAQLQVLYLEQNWLTKVPDSLSQLPQLDTLAIMGNQIKTIPEWLVHMPHIRNLYITDNPIIQPPPERLGETLTKLNPVDLEVLRRYYAQLNRAGQAYFYEAKLLLVGEGGVGKTSLATKLLDENAPLPEEDDSTEGIDILTWPFPVPAEKLPDALQESSLSLSKGTAAREAPLRQAQGPGEETTYQAKIWDFGGQSVYYATHQFFLSKRSVYVLLADTRREHYNFYDWLRMQETFGEDSPVILLLNKNRKRGHQVNIENLPYLQDRFPNLNQIIELDLSKAAEEESWPELLAHLKKHLLSLDHIGQPRPKTWVEIRKTLQADERDSISRREFLNICRDHNIPDPLDALQLSDYLHNVGDILHFEADTILSDIVILKPTWALDAVYRVLHDEEIVAANGRFTLNQLRHLWHEAKYENHRPQLLRLMEKFKLCYPLPGVDDTYIAPQLLTIKAPDYQWPGGPDDLQFRYRYPLFMPRGILSRAIVSLHHRIKEQSLVWRSGVILADDYATAELLELRGEREIRLRVTGRPKRELFMEIIRALDDLHRAFSSKLKYDKLVPCRCDTCRPLPAPHFYRLGKLMERLSNRKETIECDNSPYHEVQIRSLIDDDILRQERESGRFHHGDIYNINIKDTKESAMSFGRSGAATANN